MHYTLGFAYLALGVHMLDATRHYFNEEQPLSAALNLTFGAAAVFGGLALFMNDI